MIFTNYEQRLLDEIASRSGSGSLIDKAFKIAGKPVGKAVKVLKALPSDALQKIAGHAEKIVAGALMESIKKGFEWSKASEILARCKTLGIDLATADEIGFLPLEIRDRLAAGFRKRNGLIIAGEGSAFGALSSVAAFTPFSPVTVPALMTSDILLSTSLLAKQAAQLAACYGCSPEKPENLPHLFAAMNPEAAIADDDFLTGKTAVMRALHESNRYLSKYAVQTLSQAMLEQKAPHLVRLIDKVAQRLGVALAQKQLLLIMPLAGALLNGGVNLVFQRIGHRTVKNYFRQLSLEEKYGVGAVRREIEVRR